ncbi:MULTISPECIES: hypothetical protein [unclassified Nitratiruptor]|uniref:hypothetical protein n=1 Tax=unclassified Nitratiruptor TaxID=2624044 RepID=UPI0019164976|nr:MULTISPECIES: hypothetical protein [unclassified Nitratiruptor]BCD60943.1 hypothetical protein NitYY0810_C1721 [Nitratiruptor sp. YY08-10]BCD64875.1 hypothetical protein NitYY0814_C1729 [Nitratiruptor sp. YY08-14]
MKNFTKIIILALLAGLFSLAYAKEKKIVTQNVFKGSYLDYYPASYKNRIIIVRGFSFYEWVGKLYAYKNKIDAQTLIQRADKNAKDYATGYASAYMRLTHPNFNPKQYLLLVDHFQVEYKETENTMGTLIQGNVILIKK